MVAKSHRLGNRKNDAHTVADDRKDGVLFGFVA